MGATPQRPFSKRFPRLSFGPSSPHGNPCVEFEPGEPHAAFSHSSSVGRRLPAHLAYADASRKLTCETRSLRVSDPSHTAAQRLACHASGRCVPNRRGHHLSFLTLFHT